MKRLLRLLWITIIGAVIAVGLNDGARWGQVAADLNNSTYAALTQTVADKGKAAPGDIAEELGKQAQVQGIRITQYAIADKRLHVWSEKDVEGTWVLGPYTAMAKGVPFAKALHAKYTVKHESEAMLP
jgi:hypothetical protein